MKITVRTPVVVLLSQRDWVIQPRVATNELPWVTPRLGFNPKKADQGRCCIGRRIQRAARCARPKSCAAMQPASFLSRVANVENPVIRGAVGGSLGGQRGKPARALVADGHHLAPDFRDPFHVGSVFLE